MFQKLGEGRFRFGSSTIIRCGFLSGQIEIGYKGIQASLCIPVLVLGSLNLISLSTGVIYGQVTGLIGSLQKKDEGIILTETQISLIASLLAFTTILGNGVSAVVTDKVGRRWSFVLFSVLSVINWIILYYAREMYMFMISRIIGGISSGGLIALDLMVTSEFTRPKNRAFFLNMVTTVAPAVGSALAHGLGLIFHWRYVALIGIFPSALGIFLPYFWVESPHWLASKGKFDECEKSFRRLHGDNMSYDKELTLLMKMEENKLMTAEESNSKPTLKRLMLAFKRRYFWKLLILSLFLSVYFAAAGKLTFTTLATIMLEDITGTSDVLLFTLLVDGFSIFGSCMSCFLVMKTSMRLLLFSTGFVANCILVVLSACIYFKNGENYFNWINVSLLGFYFITINAGPCPVVEALYSEIFPLEIKMYFFFLTGIVLISAMTLSVVLLPLIVNVMGYYGLFLLNAAIMTTCLAYIWIQLPETKGKTLQEIELYFKTNNLDLDAVINNDQIKALL